MCLVLLAHRLHPDYLLVLAANRDEFYARPSAPAAFWAGAPQLLAGRDQQAGGTWLGVTRQGRWAVLTNVRGSRGAMKGRSRGLLVSDVLRSHHALRSNLAQAARHGRRFAGFNLLAGDGRRLLSLSNRAIGIRTLPPGCYGLGNELPQRPGPKVLYAKRQMAALLQRGDFHPDRLWTLLADRTLPEDADPLSIGGNAALQRALGAIFVQLPDYGTRSSSLLVIDRKRRVYFTERRFAAGGRLLGQSRYSFYLVP